MKFGLVSETDKTRLACDCFCMKFRIHFCLFLQNCEYLKIPFLFWFLMMFFLYLMKSDLILFSLSLTLSFLKCCRKIVLYRSIVFRFWSFVVEVVICVVISQPMRRGRLSERSNSTSLSLLTYCWFTISISSTYLYLHDCRILSPWRS